jgi:hypothetical protein
VSVSSFRTSERGRKVQMRPSEVITERSVNEALLRVGVGFTMLSGLRLTIVDRYRQPRMSQATQASTRHVAICC